MPIICLIQDAEHHRTTASYTLQKARFLPKFRVMMNEFVSLFMPLVYAFLLSAFVFLLLSIVLIVRKRSKNGAVPIPVGVSRKSARIPTFAIWIGIFVYFAATGSPTYIYLHKRDIYSYTKHALRNAAYAQGLYFDKNNSYKSCVACTSKDLPGFHNSSKVTLNAETGRTGFVLTATHKKCGSSVWTYQSTTETITGPSLKDGCKFSIRTLFSS